VVGTRIADVVLAVTARKLEADVVALTVAEAAGLKKSKWLRVKMQKLMYDVKYTFNILHNNEI